LSASFGRSRRLRRRGDFDRAFQRGSKKHGRLMSVFVLPHATAEPRLGVAAGRKLGGAVARNLAKRRIRETFRLARLKIGADIVVVPRADVLTAPFSSLHAEFTQLVERAIGPWKPPTVPRC
jgi:ribonuclease P protein component